MTKSFVLPAKWPNASKVSSPVKVPRVPAKKKPPAPAVTGDISREDSSPTRYFQPGPSPPVHNRTGSCFRTARTAASARANVPPSKPSPKVGNSSENLLLNTSKSETPSLQSSLKFSVKVSSKCFTVKRTDQRSISPSLTICAQRSATPRKSTPATELPVVSQSKFLSKKSPPDEPL